MTEQELLEYAYKNYPEGTTIYSSIDGKDGSECIVKYPLKYENRIKDSKNIIWNTPNGWLHSDDRWATVIKYPENYKKQEVNLIEQFNLF